MAEEPTEPTVEKKDLPTRSTRGTRSVNIIIYGYFVLSKTSMIEETK
jgi:hypothetical protein